MICNRAARCAILPRISRAQTPVSHRPLERRPCQLQNLWTSRPTGHAWLNGRIAADAVSGCAEGTTVKLYYFPAACSLACHIALREAGLEFQLVQVDTHAGRADDGRDFTELNPKGYVPALVLDNGDVLTETVAVLQYIADRNPAARLAPAAGTMERYRLIEWLSFVNSEVHKPFVQLFQPDAPQGIKDYARKTLGGRLDYLQSDLGSKAFVIGERFTVVDAYLFTLLGWGAYVNLDIGQWPQLNDYACRMATRPRVVEALGAEGLLK